MVLPKDALGARSAEEVVLRSVCLWTEHKAARPVASGGDVSLCGVRMA